MEAERASRRNRIAVAATLAAAAAILALRLLVPPIVGLADNGDFERLTHPAGLDYESDRFEDRYYGWMQPRFSWTAPFPDSSGYRTSEFLPVETAVRASRLFRAPFFDTRVLGAIHALLLLLGLALLVAACRDLATPAQAAAAALLVFFFTDVGYIGPFNSLYSQTASLLFLLLTAGIAALAVRRGSLSGGLLAAYFLSAALYICAKPQEIVQAPILALLALRLAWPGAPARRRVACAVLSALLCALAVRYYRSAEGSIGWVTRYNVLFLAILPDSPDPAADLVEMGLNPSLAKYSGLSAWRPGTPASDPAFRERLKAASPRAFLLRHPGRLRGLLREAVRAAFVLVPPDLGNFAKESGRPARAKAFSPWSHARERFGGGALLVLVTGGVLAAAALTWRRASARGRLVRESLAALVAMTAVAFATAVAGDTRVELPRHLYTFQALWDLVLAAAIVWIVQALAERRTHRRREAEEAANGSRSAASTRIVTSPVFWAVGVAGVILAVQLLIPPIVGLANNGDFEKVMGYAGFGYGTETPEEKYFGWIVTEFPLMPPGWYPSGYRTSETLLARIARVAAVPFSRNGVFDLRVLGALHMLVFLVGLGFLVGATRGLSPPTRWIVAGLLVFFFTDVGYAAVFNSFYSQMASLLFLFVTLGAAALAIRSGALQGELLVLYFAGAFLFVGSKPQESLLGPILAVFAVTVSGPRTRSWTRRPVIWLALALCVFSVWYNRQVPASFRKIALYDAVFVELLPHSPDPGADLRELDLDPSLASYSGQSPYLPSSPVFTPAFGEAFYSKFGYGKLIGFYVRHPRRLASVILRGTDQAFRLRSRALGNYEKKLGLPHHAQTHRFALWSDARLRLTPLAWLWLALVLGGNLVLALAGYRRAAPRGRLARKGLVLLVCLAVVEFLVCDLADTLIGADRHLYVFQAIFDLLLVADAAWITEALFRRRAAGLAPVPEPAA